MLAVRMTRKRAGLDGFAALLVGANEHAVRDIQLYHPAQLFWNVGGPLVGHIDHVVVALLVLHPTTDPRNDLHPCQNTTTAAAAATNAAQLLDSPSLTRKSSVDRYWAPIPILRSSSAS
jgi:hypothetical protein